MPGLRDIKRRIKSIQSTRKVTRAMQMVSAAKMRKAQEAVFASRSYANLAWELILNLAPNANFEHPLLASYPKAQKIGIVLLGTNRTLVGGLNTNLGKKLQEIKHSAFKGPAEAVVYGRQAAKIALRGGETVLADFVKEEKTLNSEDIYPLAKYVTEAYISGKYKSVLIVYNHFVSTLVQQPTVKQILPFRPVSGETRSEKKTEFLFEPSPKDVLEHLIPRIIESQIYQTILESNASEHSARMVMMKNATEAAGDLISDLTLTYNKLRQGKITTELAEITAGRIALE